MSALGNLASAWKKDRETVIRRLRQEIGALTAEAAAVGGADSEIVQEGACQEAKNRPNIDWQDKTHRGVLRRPRKFSETPRNEGVKFLLGRAE